MNPKLMIGTADPQRFEREFRPGFAGAEICYLPSWDEAVASIEYLKERGLCFGIHFPLVRNRYDGVGVHPMIMDANETKREHDLLAIGQALHEAAELGAEYLLVHYPKPAILDTALDWSDWRFPQPGEALPSDQVDLTAYESIARATFTRLGELAATAGVRLVLEHDILHPLFYRGLLRELFAEQSRQPGLGLCIDTGRLHLQESTDPGFSGVALIEALRPWITNVHLWTVRVGENKLGGHHPVLPELQKADGWGPIAEYLDALAAVPEATVLFEHRSSLVTSQQLDECYDWVRGRLQGQR